MKRNQHSSLSRNLKEKHGSTEIKSISNLPLKVKIPLKKTPVNKRQELNKPPMAGGAKAASNSSPKRLI